MQQFDPKTLDTAFVPSGTPMFVDLVHRIEADASISPTRARDMISGLRRVADALGRPVEQVPADPKWLQPRLAQIAPAAIGLATKSWQNAVSDARAAMVHAGIVQSRRNHIDDLSPSWRRLWEAVLASRSRTLTPALCRFVHFLNRQGVNPQEVNDAHAAAYRDALALNEISKSPDVAFRAAANGWNLAGRLLPDWPRQTLTLPSRARRIVLPLETYPASFRADLHRYIETLANPDPFDDAARAAPLRPATVRQYRRTVERFAAILVKAGVAAEEIETLAALVAPERLRLGLRRMLDDNGGKTSVNIEETASLHAWIARTYVRVSESDQAELDRIARKLKLARPKGLTRKNQERLRVLKAPNAQSRLLTLPERLFRRAASIGSTFHAGLLREDALAIAILSLCPIRRKNLAGIHIDRNLSRPGDGRAFLLFEEDEVKNGRRLEYELPRDLVRMIDSHLASRSPEMCPAATPWLFPKRDGSGPMDLSQLGGRIKKRILDETGIIMNAHLFRHLAAMLYLDAMPGQYEVVRRLLGHSELSSTLNAYAGFEAGTATRLFAEVVEKAKRR